MLGWASFSLLFIFIFFSFVLLLFFPVAVAGEAAAVAVREAVWPGPSSAAERAARPSSTMHARVLTSICCTFLIRPAAYCVAAERRASATAAMGA